MFTIQASGNGWKMIRPSGLVMNLETLRYALFLAEDAPVIVLDKEGNQIA